MTTAPQTYPRLTMAHLRGFSGSNLRALHLSDDPAIVGLLSGIDGYTRARADIVTLSSYTPPVFTPPADPEPLMTKAILDAIDAGRPIPEDLVDQVPDTSRIREEYAMAGRAVNQARDALRWRLDGLVEQNRDLLLGGLTKALVDVVDAARAIAERGGLPPDAEDAIASGRVKDYEHGRELEQTYARLRSLHAALEVAGHGNVHLDGKPKTFRFYLENPIDAVPDLVDVLNGQSPEVGYNDIRNPWPETWMAGATVWWFAANPPARPWAPTERQLAAQAEIVNSLRYPTRPDNRRRPLDPRGTMVTSR